MDGMGGGCKPPSIPSRVLGHRHRVSSARRVGLGVAVATCVGTGVGCVAGTPGIAPQPTSPSFPARYAHCEPAGIAQYRALCAYAAGSSARRGGLHLVLRNQCRFVVARVLASTSLFLSSVPGLCRFRCGLGYCFGKDGIEVEVGWRLASMFVVRARARCAVDVRCSVFGFARTFLPRTSSYRFTPSLSRSHSL